MAQGGGTVVRYGLLFWKRTGALAPPPSSLHIRLVHFQAGYTYIPQSSLECSRRSVNNFQGRFSLHNREGKIKLSTLARALPRFLGASFLNCTTLVVACVNARLASDPYEAHKIFTVRGRITGR